MPTYYGGEILGDVADVMTVRGKNLDGVMVIGIVGFCCQGAFELAEVVGDAYTMSHTCNREFHYVCIMVTARPYAGVIAFVFNTEVLEFLDWCIRITAA